MEYTISELNGILSASFHHISDEYGIIKIKGEISNIKIFKNCIGCSFILRDNASQINCKAWSRSIDIDKIQEYENKICFIIGKIKYEYFNGHQFVIELINDVLFDSDDSEIKKLKLKCEEQKYFITKKNIKWNNIKIIGIISKKDTQGYIDFISQFMIPLNIVIKEIALEGLNTEQEVISAIYELQYTTDAIFIIRGGGCTSNISMSFDKMSIFDSIRQSQVPIITAIGHEADKDDKLLITNVSDFNFPTPSSAAKELNKIYIKPVYDKINSILQELQYKFTENIDKNKEIAYEKLKIYFDNIFRKKIGGQIIKLEYENNYIIIEKNGKYYKNEIQFNDRISIDNNDIILKKKIYDNILYQNINEIKNLFEFYNDSIFSSEINNIIKEIELIQKEEDLFNNIKSKEYKILCNEENVINNFNNIDNKKIKKIYKIYLRYIEILEELNDRNKIKIIYDFIVKNFNM